MFVGAEVACDLTAEASELLGELAVHRRALPDLEIGAGLDMVGGIVARRGAGPAEQFGWREAVIPRLAEHHHAGGAQQRVEAIDHRRVRGQRLQHFAVADDGIVIADAEVGRLQDRDAGRFLNDERDQRKQLPVLAAPDRHRIRPGRKSRHQTRVDRRLPQRRLEHGAALQAEERTIFVAQKVKVGLDADLDVQLQRLQVGHQHRLGAHWAPAISVRPIGLAASIRKSRFETTSPVICRPLFFHRKADAAFG